jgi:hypothetical protein
MDSIETALPSAGDLIVYEVLGARYERTGASVVCQVKYVEVLDADGRLEATLGLRVRRRQV